jgi:uncharacterized ion transporter superfamily protein YfcC
MIKKIKLPHPVIMLFGIMIMATILSYTIPTGSFDRVEIDGRMTVVADSYKKIDQPPLGIGDFFMALPIGFKTAIDIIFIIFASGIMFGMLKAVGTLETAIAVFVRNMGTRNPKFIVFSSTFLFGLMGIFIGYENNIALVPIAAMLSLAIGGDLILAAGIAVGGITVGFGLSPVNPYTIGTAHKIANLPLFSGYELRTVMCAIGLTILAIYNTRYYTKLKSGPEYGLGENLNQDSFKISKPLIDYSFSVRDIILLFSFIAMIGVMLFGVFKYHWFLNELSAVFCSFAFITALFLWKDKINIGQKVLDSVGEVAPGAFMVGLAASIKVILEKGAINDTIAYYLSDLLKGLPSHLSGVGMVLMQTIINFIIPSGSGQALATMPILLPVGDVLGLTKQTVTLAFQFGDGISNLINPTLGGIVAMTAICGVPFDRWLKYIFPVFLILLLVGLIFVFISVIINYGPA